MDKVRDDGYFYINIDSTQDYKHMCKRVNDLLANWLAFNTQTPHLTFRVSGSTICRAANSAF